MKLHLPSHTTIAAYGALFVALGGTAAAAPSILGRNSVGTPQVRNGAITSAKLSKQARSLTSTGRIAHIVTDTMTSDQVLSALANAVKGDPGIEGGQGPAGPAGDAGANGASGPQGSQGAPGAPGAPPAAARIGADGTVLWSSNGEVQAAKVGDFYCIRVTGGGLSSGVVTLDDNGIYTDQALVGPASNSCAGYGLQVAVVSVTSGGNVAATSHGFSISLD